MSFKRPFFCKLLSKFLFIFFWQKKCFKTANNSANRRKRLKRASTYNVYKIKVQKIISSFGIIFFKLVYFFFIYLFKFYVSFLGYIYYPVKDGCYAAYRKGPCAIGEHLVLRKGQVIPECANNPCDDGYAR